MIKANIVIAVEYQEGADLADAEFDRDRFKALVNQYFNSTEPFSTTKNRVDYTIVDVQETERAQVETCYIELCSN